MSKIFDFNLANDVIQQIVTCQPGAIEHFLMLLHTKIDKIEFDGYKRKPTGSTYTIGGYDEQLEADREALGK